MQIALWRPSQNGEIAWRNFFFWRGKKSVCVYSLTHTLFQKKVHLYTHTHTHLNTLFSGFRLGVLHHFLKVLPDPVRDETNVHPRLAKGEWNQEGKERFCQTGLTRMWHRSRKWVIPKRAAAFSYLHKEKHHQTRGKWHQASGLRSYLLIFRFLSALPYLKNRTDPFKLFLGDATWNPCFK